MPGKPYKATPINNKTIKELIKKKQQIKKAKEQLIHTLKDNAIRLRQAGYTIRETATLLNTQRTTIERLTKEMKK